MSEAKERKRKIRGIFEEISIDDVEQLLSDSDEQQQYENERNVQVEAQQLKRKIFN